MKEWNVDFKNLQEIKEIKEKYGLIIWVKEFSMDIKSVDVSSLKAKYVDSPKPMFYKTTYVRNNKELKILLWGLKTGLELNA